MRTTALTRLTVALTLAATASALSSLSLASAATPAPHWTIMSSAGPTYFKVGDVGDYYEVIAINDGGVGTSGEVSLTDLLPPGVTATAIAGEAQTNEFTNSFQRLECSLATVSCDAATSIQPGEVAAVKIIVSISPTASGPLTNNVTITGGGAESGHASSSTPISSEPVPFGASLVSHVASEDSSDDTQAGSHPFGFTSILAFNVGSINKLEECQPQQLHGCPGVNFNPKDLRVALPSGLVGNPLATPRCSQAQFQTDSNISCPPDTQVGALQLYFDGNGTQSQYASVYNVEPPPGQPAELGFTIGAFFHIPMFFHVRSDGDYGLTANLEGITEVDTVNTAVLTIWGVPGASSHDSERSSEFGCAEGCASHAGVKPFLTLPTRCTDEELAIGVSGDSWQSPETFLSQLPAHIPGITGCEALAFAPSLEVQPDLAGAETPSGYSVNLKVPQTDTQESLATPSLRNAVVTLPAGTVISASAANGLQACSEAQLGIDGEAAAECPSQSNIGEVEVVTPLLEKPLHGSLYVAQPKCGGEGQPPCTQASATNGELYGLYLVVEGYGIVIKLKGSVSANPITGQLTATFKENPQLPFSELRVHLHGGAAAPLANPQNCGTFTTTSDLTPWSAPATPNATPSSTFQLTNCANPTPFAPTFSAGTLVPNATGSSPFTLTVGRHDGEQYLSGISTTLPPGLLGKIAQVPLCEEPQAAAGECSEVSRIGTTSAAAGSGPYPFWLGGKVFLTGPYEGAPFGLSIVVPAKAGPFNLGNEVIRARITVDPATAAVTVMSSPLPQMKDGIPVRLHTVDVTIDRPGFILNPSNCEQHSITGTISGAQGAAESVSSPFAVEGCGYLSFKPRFTASTKAKTSKRNGASLEVNVTLPTGHEANIHSVKVALPLTLPSRLSTLQRACTAAVFEANPARCPAESAVGVVTAKTPVLPGALTGPAYLVSHGGGAFPDLVLVLQGDGVRVNLTGNTDIKKGITTSTFRSLPDVPVTFFNLRLPAGQFSVLAAYGNLCKQQLRMPTRITGQNGAQIKQNTKIAVTGCPSSISVSSHGVKKRTLTLSVYAPAAGKLTASGKGVSSATKSSGGQETVTIVLHQKNAGKLKTKVTVRFTPKSGKKQSKTVGVDFKK